MNKSERKQEGANQSGSIHLSNHTELLPVTREKLVTLCETLKRDQLTPWLWFNSRGVRVKNFYGKAIGCQGVEYDEGIARVFLESITPFLRDAIVKTLDETLETCRTRRLKPEEPYLRETAMFLDGYLIDPIYRYIADIDRLIRGKGDPKSVKRRDVIDQINRMVKFLDKCVEEMIQGIKAKKAGDIREPLRKAEQGEKITKDEANVRARQLLKETPTWDWTCRKLAKLIPCPLAWIPYLPVWRAYHEKRKELRSKTIKTVSLSDELEAVLGEGEKDEVLKQLIAEQEGEEREDERRARLYLNIQRKPKRSGR